METEIWENVEGSALEISWDDKTDICFYRAYPWNSENKRLWQGFTAEKDLRKKGYFYVKTIQ